MDFTSISLEDLKYNEVINITKTKRLNLPPFTMIGKGTTMNGKITSIDLLDEVRTMDSNERLCFYAIKDAMRYDYTANRTIFQVRPMGWDTYTNSQKSKFSKGYKTLKDKRIVARVSKGVYMINPIAMIPNNTFFLEEKRIWDEACGNTPKAKPKPKPTKKKIKSIKPKSTKPTKLLYEYDSNIIDISDTSAEVFPLDSYDTYGEQEYVTRDRVIKYGIKVNHSN